MADITVEQKKGGQNTWLWATLAVLSVVGLMLWLASQDVETGPVVVEEDGAAETATPAAETVELPAIAADPGSFAGRTVAVNNATVAATLGPRAFWADIPGQNPFLVVADANAGAGQLASGQRVNLVGSVAEVTPEVVDQWIAAGAVNEGAREEATFATHFLQATRVGR